MVVVDTSVWVDYLNGSETAEVVWLDRHLTTERLGVLDLVLCEVLQGVTNEHHATRVRKQLAVLDLIATGGVNWAERSARNFRILRGRGLAVRRTIDCLIATWCIDHGLTLLHADRDFDPFAAHLGLAVVQTER